MKELYPQINTDIDRQVGFNTFPYTSLLSFAPLIKFWKSKTNSRDRGTALLAHEIIQQLDASLDLLTPIRDVELLTKHKSFIDLLMSGLFAFAQQDQQMGQAVRPFSLEGFYRTNRFIKFLKNNRLSIINNKDVRSIRQDAIVRAGCMILNTFYGQKFPLKDPYIFTARADDTFVETHYKAALNLDFLEIKKKRALPALSEEEIFELINNFDKPELWLEKIPPTHFEFHGLVAVNLVDVTEEEAMSRIRQFLLQRDAVLEEHTIAQMEDLLSSYFNVPGLRLGLTEYKTSKESGSTENFAVRQHLLKKAFPELKIKEYEQSIYYQSVRDSHANIFQNITKLKDKTPLEEQLIKEGIQSIYIAPLERSSGKIFGILELAAPGPYALNSFTRIKIKEIQPLFRSALSRKVDEINNAIGAIIRKKYTNIHPSVEWRFLEEANRILFGESVEPKPIIFENVYPLYGQADVVSSTMQRNRAIQADMMENWQELLILLQLAKKYGAPEKADAIIRLVEEIKLGHETMFTPDEELESRELIASVIHPFLHSVKNIHAKVLQHWEEYGQLIDPKLGMIATRRKNFEASMLMINQTIVSFLDEEEAAMQKVLPHYFERYQTDGISYDLFLGNSLLKTQRFEIQQLETFRLWQLKSMCELTRRIANLQSDLSHHMTTAQLILVYSLPMTIRFRMDEKKFDVDGNDNVRYALLKKRIDKALILGTANRLTLPGKVAIVYSQDKDRQEYQKYLDYLIEKKIIEPNVENLELAALQGIKGLKALRITVLT